MTKGVGAKIVEAGKEVDSDFTVVALVSQLNDLTIKISEVEDLCRHQGKYIPPHAKRKPKKMTNVP